MEFISANFKGVPCEVYFFKGWGTYTHPVTPTGAIELEGALTRKGYYRAWLCKIDNKDMFVYFEGVENKMHKTDIPIADKDKNYLRFYARDVPKQKLGRELLVNETLDIESFYVSLPNSDCYSLITQKKGIRYEYKYDEKGILHKIIVTDFEGNVKILEN